MRKGFLRTGYSVFIGLVFIFLAVTPPYSVALYQNHANIYKKLQQYKEGEAVVKLKEDKQNVANQAFALQTQLGKQYALSVVPFHTDKSLVKVVMKTRTPMAELIRKLESQPQVQYAEPNWIYRIQDQENVIPNDPGFNMNWGLLNTGQDGGKPGADIGATKAWVQTKGSKDFIVAVIDTGVDYTHEDLKNNIFLNDKEVPDNTIDDDANGFVDDVRGWNFEKKTNDPMDDNRHGTHVSGTIGAEGNNSIGTAGVNWNTRILPIKFLSEGGSGSLADAVESIKYATLMKAHIMSNSWGGGGYTQSMFEAIKEAKEKGILFVAAAGNDSNDNDASPTYPATYNLENVISVAATDKRDRLASFSSYGKNTVHLSAPGVAVYSTVPAAHGTYASFSGTSMATPHVSGAAALLWSANPQWTFTEIKERLLATADPIRILKNKTAAGGRLNVNNAILNIIPEKNEPPAEGWLAAEKTLETEHPYKENSDLTFEISHPGAKYLRVHFSKFEVEKGFDSVLIEDALGEQVEEVSGEYADYTSEYVVGEKLVIRLKSDYIVNKNGFTVDRYDFIE